MSDVGSNTLANAPKSRRRALWIVLGLIGAVLASLVAIYVSVWSGAGRVIDRERERVPERIAALRAERVTRPLLFEPAEEGNGWELLAQALDAIAGLSEDDYAAFPHAAAVEARTPRLEKVEAVLIRLAPQFEALKSALRRTWVEPDYPYEKHHEMVLPLLAKSIRSSRVLADAAQIRHDAGRTSEAAEFLVMAWGIADRMSVKGAMVHDLVKMTCAGIAGSQLREILAHHRFSNQDLTRLQSALDRLAAARGDVMGNFRTEDLMARAWVVDFEHGDGRLSGHAELRGSAWDLYSARIMAARYLAIQDRFMAEMERASRLPSKPRLAALKGLQKEIQESGNDLHMFLATQVELTWRRLAQGELALSLARVALALARHREDWGGYPSALGDLVPGYLSALPVDEYSGNPWVYVVKDDAASIYSFGGDGDDDGGRPVPEYDYDGNGDVVWTVKRAK